MTTPLEEFDFDIDNLDLFKPFFEQLFNSVVITTSQLELPGPQIIYANSAFCKQTGYSFEEILGKTPRILQGEQTSRDVLNRLKQKLQAGEFFQDSTINYRKDGTSYWVEWNISALYNKKGELSHYFCVQHDVSAYKQLEQSQKLLQEYKDAVDDGSILSKADKNGIITYVNSEFCKISGYEKDEIIGKPHSIVRHPHMPKEIFSDLWHTIKNLKKTWRGEIKNLKKDGSYYWVEATIKPILDNKGEIVEFIGLRTDITQLQNYKESLNNELEDTSNSLKEYEDAIINNSAIAKLSTKFTIEYVNDKYLQLTKYKKSEMLKARISDFISWESLENRHGILKIVQKGRVYTGNFKGKPKYGEPFYTETTIKPIKNINGDICEYLLIMHDVTPLVNSHLEIEATQKEIVYKMGEIGESRSKETGNHVKRVAEYSRLLALLYGLSYKEAETLFTASPMHDIGKVAIADSILNKPGKLTKEEFEVMKSHANIGYKVLEGSSREVLKAAAIVAYEHHEKWDGSGYPRGLKGEQIHIYGRITAIADVLDALGHDRVYKKAWDLDRILELFKEQRAKHFDPILIDIFFKNLDKFLEIKEKFDD
ncbi:MAG: PAS domain-containing protein [Campylobacterota bacterium]